ncbi:hypothetical protein CIW83_02755 [Tissierella sp. P1]|uniref:hypothetical protein n=1 Tax=Tissierella sp. P1 TaxID=1280483 RepID=UPI000BA093E9|nr:hypothetical protein [Tissierella sp. P1]OZV13482.1 hypothetical protein CIW83_02755 [Tissierella sp. P1]
MFYKHFLDAIVMTDSFISFSQSVKELHKEISQEEYFNILITEMHISLRYEHLYKKYIKDIFKEKIFDKIMSNSDHHYNSREVNSDSLEE